MKRTPSTDDRSATTPELAPRSSGGTTPPGPLGRVVVENVRPEIDGGRFPIKRTVGESIEVSADIHAEGHDVLSAVLRFRPAGDPEWAETPMEALPNDRWRAEFRVNELVPYEYTLLAWVDHFQTWRRSVRKKVDAGQDVSLELLVGARLIEEAAERAAGADAALLRTWSLELRQGTGDTTKRIHSALDAERGLLVSRYPERASATAYERILGVTVDREKARFSTWYELFPRSASREPGRHGTFKDCEALLPYLAEMGFDVLYLPPIHPIGHTNRKGKNNSTVATPDDVGSPWAIGSEAGGHKAIHPELGTLDDFRRLVTAARQQGIEVALDFAAQCSPDHPYVKEHPEWFRLRPDGSVQYAENPPKKYEDIYPLEFESSAWQSLWEELKTVFLFWIEQGIRIFRVDNPHTKPYAFWEWVIREIKRDYPETIFLSEAFTRPKVMARLAKVGFTQSYTYFTWRNTSWEIREYFTELTQSEVREFFRPHLWPNTPDILTEYLQAGGRPAFAIRLILAATLGASFGIYGPAFELGENRAMTPGSEEYLDSEKYQIRHWDLDQPNSLRHLIARVNRIRRDYPALQSDRHLKFHPVTSEQLVAYSKSTDDRSNMILVVVNLDPHHTHSGVVELPLTELGLDPQVPYQMHDLLSDARYLWSGPRNTIELDPGVIPAAIFHVRRRLRTERDFDYYL